MEQVAGLSERELARVRGRLVEFAQEMFASMVTNCCRHCSSPSGKRAAIGSMLLRSTS